MNKHPLTRTVALLVALVATTAAARADDPADGTESALILLVDRSGSMAQISPPETTQAFVTHAVQVADLSQQPVKIAIVLFNGKGVKVLGDEKGRPTAAHKNLLDRLNNEWRAPEGGTPLDQAMKECVKLTDGAENAAVILFSDGEPDSGYLRPRDFKEVDVAVAREREKHLAGAPADAAPEFRKALADQFEAYLSNPNSPLWKQIHTLQIEAEFQQTLAYAQQLKRRQVRFVTVDYAGPLPRLREIHTAAGGDPRDYVVAKPAADSIPKLHALKLTALPRVLTGRPKTATPEPGVAELTVPCALDSLAEAALVTLVFDPPLSDFGDTTRLTVTVGGRELKFGPGGDPDCLLGQDGKGDVLTASLALDRMPDDRRAVFKLSCGGAVPTCTAYTHQRLQKSLVGEFRPENAKPPAPYRLSAKRKADFFTGVVSAERKVQPVERIEVVLRHRRDGKETRVSAEKHPSTAGAFRTTVPPLPKRGLYDVTLVITTKTSTSEPLELPLPRHVESQPSDEHLLVEVPPGSPSHSAGSLQFGEVGDAVTKVKLTLQVHLSGADERMKVRASAHVQGPGGHIPAKPWVTFAFPEKPVTPGKPTTFDVVLAIPDDVEEAAEDGVFRGEVTFADAETGEPLDVRPVGRPDGPPPNQITFSLRRPRIGASAPRWTKGDALKGQAEGRVLPVYLDVATPYAATVRIQAGHDSALSRKATLTVRPFQTPDGQPVRQALLTLADDSPAEQEIEQGTNGAWRLDLRVAGPLPGPVSAEVEVHGPGLRSERFRVELRPRKHLLAGPARSGLAWAAGLFGVFGLWSAVLLWRARRVRPGQLQTVRSGETFHDVFTVRAGRDGTPVLVAGRPLLLTRGGERPRPLREHGTLPLPLAEWKPGRPRLRIEEVRVGEPEPRVFAVTHVLRDGAGAEVGVETVAAGADGRNAARFRGRTRLWIALAVMVTLIAFFLTRPPLLGAAQWLLDLLIHP